MRCVNKVSSVRIGLPHMKFHKKKFNVRGFTNNNDNFFNFKMNSSVSLLSYQEEVSFLSYFKKADIATVFAWRGLLTSILHFYCLKRILMKYWPKTNSSKFQKMIFIPAKNGCKVCLIMFPN